MGPTSIGATLRKIARLGPVPEPREMPRRISHGDESIEITRYQPQDGAVDPLRRVMDISSRLLQSSGEPEDARLTGGTRSLMRRLSGLNMVKRAVAMPARSVTRKGSMSNANVA